MPESGGRRDGGRAALWRSPSSSPAPSPCCGRTFRRCSTCPAIWAAIGSSSISPTRRPPAILRLRWALIGNLGIDLLVQLLAPLIGLEPAVKLIVAADPAADRRRPALGRLRGPWADPADGPVRPPLRLQLSLPVRLRELRAGDGPRAQRLRPVAEAGSPGQARVSGGPVRADLGDPLDRPCLRLGTLGVLAFSAELVRQHDRGHNFIWPASGPPSTAWR